MREWIDNTLYPRVNMEDEVGPESELMSSVVLFQVVKEFTAKPVSVAYKSLGPALLSCCSSLLKNNIESLIHQLSSDIKVCYAPSYNSHFKTWVGWNTDKF